MPLGFIGGTELLVVLIVGLTIVTEKLFSFICSSLVYAKYL